jgi:excinuclease UvrABC nuclease subunit
VNYKSGKWVCYYVGKAEDLESRLLDHLSSNEPNFCIKENIKYKCGFMWLSITTDSERSGAEKFLYDTLKPECNQKDPGGSPLRVTPPPTPTATAPSQ